MALDLGTASILVTAAFGSLRDAEAALRRFDNNTDRTRRGTDRLSGAQGHLEDVMRGTTRTAQLILGPLSGIASRIGNVSSIINTGTVGLALFTVGISTFVGVLTTAIAAATKFESVIANVNGLLQATGKVSTTSSKQVLEIAKRFSEITATPLQETLEGIQSALTIEGIDSSNLEDFMMIAKATSRVFGENLVSSTLSWGKAIQSPRAGLEALAERGLVSFNTEQKNMLQLMTQTGDRAKVAAIFLEQGRKKLGELGREGGTLTKAFADLGGAWEEFKIRIIEGNSSGNKFSEVLSNLTGKLREWTQDGGLADEIGRAFNKTIDYSIKAVELLKKNMGTLTVAFKIYLSSKVVGLAIASLKGFSNVVLAVGVTLGVLARRISIFGRILASSLSRGPLVAFMGVFTALATAVSVGVAAISGAYIAWGATQVDTGNVLLDVWVSVLAFWMTFKRRMIDAWKDLSGAAKTLAINVSTKFLEMFPNISPNLTAALNAFTNFANTMLTAIARLAITGAVIWHEKFGKKLTRGFEAAEIMAELKKAHDAVKDFRDTKVLSPATEEEYRKLLKNVTELGDKLESLRSNQDVPEDLGEAIRRAHADAIMPDIGAVSNTISSAYESILQPVITDIVKFGKEAGIRFNEEFLSNLKSLEAKYKIKPAKISGFTAPDSSTLLGDQKQSTELALSFGVTLGNAIKEGLDSSTKGIGENWAKNILGFEHTKWRDIGKGIATAILGGILDDLIVKQSVDSIKNTLASLFAKASSPGGAKAVNLDSGSGLQWLMQGIQVASAAIGIGGGGASGLLPGKEDLSGFTTENLIQAETFPGFSAGLQGSTITNNINISSPEPSSFISSTNRVESAMSGASRRSL